MPKKVRVGLFGVGHLGKIHAHLLKEISGFHVVGFFDPNAQVATATSEELNLKIFENPASLIREVDALVIASPTTTHFEIATACVKAGKHIFVEKPVTETAQQAKKLAAMVDEAGVKAAVGHVERFNPAMLALNRKKIKPVFIEAHRLAQFNPRGTDVSVVHDLMIHDLDIMLSLVNAEVSKISASGVAIISSSLDIANARIEFANGCVANLTSSRISMKNMRKMRVFQPGAYISIDFLKGKSDVIKIHQNPLPAELPNFEIDFGNKKRFLTIETRSKQDVNAIKLELELFLKSIVQNKAVEVGVADGFKAMQLAHRVMEAIEKHSGKVKSATGY